MFFLTFQIFLNGILCLFDRIFIGSIFFNPKLLCQMDRYCGLQTTDAFVKSVRGPLLVHHCGGLRFRAKIDVNPTQRFFKQIVSQICYKSTFCFVHLEHGIATCNCLLKIRCSCPLRMHGATRIKTNYGGTPLAMLRPKFRFKNVNL